MDRRAFLSALTATAAGIWVPEPVTRAYSFVGGWRGLPTWALYWNGKPMGDLWSELGSFYIPNTAGRLCMFSMTQKVIRQFEFPEEQRVVERRVVISA